MHSICTAKTFKEELEWLQQQDIMTSLDMDETTELCIGPARLNQALMRMVIRRPTLNATFPKLNNVQYLSLVDVSSGYHNLKLDQISSCLTTFAGQCGIFRYKILPFGVAPAGDMFQRNIDEIFKTLPNVFGIADDI